MALITPLHSRLTPTKIHVPGLENSQLLCVDLLSDELWSCSSSSSDNQDHLKFLKTKWNPSLSTIKNVTVKRASDEDMETAAILLRSSFNFYKDSSCALLPSGINLYIVPSQLASETYIQPGIDGVDILDMNTSRKLLLWAYTLLQGYYQSLSTVIKFCEETTKPKAKKATGASSTPSNPCTSSANVTPTSVCAEEVDASSQINSSDKTRSIASRETGNTTNVATPVPNLGSVSEPNSEIVCNSTSSDA